MNPSIHPSSAAASAAADAASVLRSPCQCGSVLGFRFRIQRQSSSGRPMASGTPRVLAAGQGTPSFGLRRTRRSPFSGGPRSCAALDRRCGCPRLRLEWREVSGGGWVPGPPAASCSSAPSDSLAGRSPRQSEQDLLPPGGQQLHRRRHDRLGWQETHSSHQIYFVFRYFQLA
jgi:hypothetical protein